MKKVIGLTVTLLILMLVFGLTFMFGGQFQKVICEQDGYTYSGGVCNSGANESDAYNSTGSVIAVVKLVLGFLSIIVLAVLVRVIIQEAKFKNLGM